MGDLLTRFDGEAEFLRSGGFPRLQGFQRRHSIERGVDLHAIEARGVGLQHSPIRKIRRIELAFPFLVAESRSAKPNLRHSHIMAGTARLGQSKPPMGYRCVPCNEISGRSESGAGDGCSVPRLSQPSKQRFA